MHLLYDTVLSGARFFLFLLVRVDTLSLPYAEYLINIRERYGQCGTGPNSHYRREIHTIMKCELGGRVMIE